MDHFEELLTNYSFLSEEMYHINQAGVWICEKDEDGNWKPKKTICKKPILPTALLDNPDDSVQKVEVSYWDMNRWKKLLFPRETLTNKSKVTQLANSGIPVGTDNSKDLAFYFNNVIGQHDSRIPRKTALNHLGWVDVETDDGSERVFAPYTNRVVFDDLNDNGSLFKAVSKKGNRDEWISMMRELRKNIPMRLTMAASFASPLIEMVGENPFILHLWGGTGSGKTVSILVAMSIWGNPRMGKLTRTMNMTVNSMLSTAAFLNSLPFAGDELQTIKTKWGNYDDLIMCVTEGVNRGRMRFDKILPSFSWNCSFIFSGEEPCVKEDSGGGAVNRVIQIEANQQIVADGNKTANFVRQNYGHVGEEFIGVVKNIPELIRASYEETKSSLMECSNTTEKQAGAMALLMTADYLASRQFWDDEPALTVDDVKCYLADVNQVDATERAWNFVCSLIAQFGSNFDSEAREVWGRIENGEVLFIKSVLIDKMNKAGYDFDACKRKWSNKGYIKKDKHGRIQHYVSIGGKPAYCVQIVMPVLLNEELTDYNGSLPF